MKNHSFKIAWALHRVMECFAEYPRQELSAGDVVLIHYLKFDSVITKKAVYSITYLAKNQRLIKQSAPRLYQITQQGLHYAAKEIKDHE